MQSTACHYQCQNTNTCHTDVKQELITHLQGLLLSCIFWVTTLHSEGHRLPQYTHTPPLLHTGFLNTHTAFTAHRLPQYTHTHHLALTSTAHRLQHIHHLALKSTAHRLPQHTHHLALSLLNSTTVCAAWAPDHHQGNPGLKVTFDPRDYYPCHLATVITCIHVLSPCHCYNMHTCVVNLPLL